MFGIVIMFLFALRAHWVKRRGCTLLQSSLFEHMLITVAMLVWELFMPKVLLLYLIIAVSLVEQPKMLYLLLNQHKAFMSDYNFTIHSRILMAYIVIFLTAIGFAFMPPIGTKCDGEIHISDTANDWVVVYPTCFYMAFLFYITFWIYQTVLYCKNYSMEDEKVHALTYK